MLQVYVYICTVHVYVQLFHITMEISMHSVENIPRYTADTVGACDNLLYYLVMHAHVKPDSTLDILRANALKCQRCNCNPVQHRVYSLGGKPRSQALSRYSTPNAMKSGNEASSFGKSGFCLGWRYSLGLPILAGTT